MRMFSVVAAASKASNPRPTSTPIVGDIPSANALPAGALSFTATWDDVGSEAGYVVYVATSTQATPDPALYPYRYLVAANTLSLVISSVASGTKYVRVAGYENGYVGDLSFEQTYTPA